MARKRQSDLARAGDELLSIAEQKGLEITVSKQLLNRVDGVEVVRMRREQHDQDIGYSSRPFVLCGLPVRRPPKGTLLHARRNGDFLLEVTGHPSYGLPFGQDRLIPLWLSTLAVKQRSQTIRFTTAAEMLDAFGMHRGGKEYRRLIAGFERVFASTVFFGTDTQKQKARVIHKGRFSFMKDVQLWYSKDPDQKFLPGEFENYVVLSDEFYAEVTAHPIPCDLEAVRELAHAPAQLDLFLWLTWRCWTAKMPEIIPLFGPRGLENQLGVAEATRPRRFRQRLEKWLNTIRTHWPECPARISANGEYLDIDHAESIHGRIGR